MSLPMSPEALAWVLLEETCECLEHIHGSVADTAADVDALRNCFSRIHTYVEIRDACKPVPFDRPSAAPHLN